MIWFLFARWPGYAAAVVSLVIGAFLMSLGILFVMVYLLTSSLQGQVPWAIAMIIVGAVLMAIVGLWATRRTQSEYHSDRA